VSRNEISTMKIYGGAGAGYLLAMDTTNCNNHVGLGLAVAKVNDR